MSDETNLNEPSAELAGAAADGAGSRVPHRLAWALVDQGLSSGGNLVGVVAAARVLAPSRFGAFAAAMTIALIVATMVRSIVAEPLLAVYATATPRQRRRAFRMALGSAFVIGLIVSVPAALVMFGVASNEPALAWAVLVTVPGLCLQDALRFCAFCERRPRRAVFNDATWLVALAIALVGAAHAPSAATYYLAWAGTASFAALVTLVAQRHSLAPRRALLWVSRHRGLSGPYFGEFLSASGVANAVSLLLGSISGLVALAAVRGGQTLFGPVNVLFAGLIAVLIPEGAMLRRSRPRLVRLMVLTSVGFVVIGCAWTAAGVFMPSSIGRRLLGASWPGAHHVLLPIGIGYIASGIAGGGITGLRALAAARDSLRAQLVSIPLLVALPIGGAVLGDAYGFCVGFAVAKAANAIIVWLQFRVSLRGSHKFERHFQAVTGYVEAR